MLVFVIAFLHHLHLAPPNPPFNITVEFSSSGDSMHVTWKADESEEALMTFTLECCLMPEVWNCTVVAGLNQSGYNIEGLQPFRTYRIGVRATTIFGESTFAYLDHVSFCK